MIEKACSKCDVSQPVDKEHFGRTPTGGYRGVCRACMRERSAKHHKDNPSRPTKRGSRASAKHSANKAKMLKAQNNQCVYCHIDITNSNETDHKTPISRGGTDSKYNVHLTCPPCNREKHNKTHEEHLRWRKLCGYD